MADKYLNATGIAIIRDWVNGKFSTKEALAEIQEQVNDLIEAGGEPNVIETVKVNGTALVPDANKAVDIPVPTEGTSQHTSGYVTYASFSQLADGTYSGSTNNIIYSGENITELTNNANYQTNTQVQTAIDNALADITGIDFEVVQALPQTGEKGVIYLLANSGSGQNIYDEYIWIDGDPTGRFEKIGTTAVDLSNYWTMTAGQANSLIAMTVAEINAILEPSA